jgi:hypothetical protein
MFKRFLLLGALASLSSCAYTLDKQIQDITVVTPGAEDAVCYMYVDGLRYKFFPPQTMNITKSRQDLVVDCLAPQNRRRKVIIEPTLSDHAPLNVVNGVVPGAAWDIASNSMFTYPDVVTVDFTSAQPMPEPLPAQNNPDIRQPEDYDLEEFTSGLPRLNSDRGATKTELIRRGGKPAPEVSYTDSKITPHTGPGKPADKADSIGSVIDGLTTPSKPLTAPAPEPAPAPVAAPATTAPASDPNAVGSIAPYPLSTKPAPAGQQSGPPIPLVPEK